MNVKIEVIVHVLEKIRMNSSAEKEDSDQLFQNQKNVWCMFSAKKSVGLHMASDLIRVFFSPISSQLIFGKRKTLINIHLISYIPVSGPFNLSYRNNFKYWDREV